MSAEIDEVISSGTQEDNVEEFLTKMVSSGQRYLQCKRLKHVYVAFLDTVLPVI